MKNVMLVLSAVLLNACCWDVAKDIESYQTQDVNISILPADSVISLGDTLHIEFLTAALEQELTQTQVSQMQIGITTTWFNNDFNSPSDDKVAFIPLSTNINNEYGGHYLNILSYEDGQLNLVFNVAGFYVIDFEPYGSHFTKAKNHCKDLIETAYSTNLIINNGETNAQYNAIFENTSGNNFVRGFSYFIKVH